jgi:hypothetical protein
MSLWLYQINQTAWSPNRYRLEIWEGERWASPVGQAAWGGTTPQPGDIVVFFYAPAGGTDPGFYGWAVILEWLADSKELYFRPVAPSDQLKMRPWWSDAARTLADNIRGKMQQRTLWHVSEDLATELRGGLQSWVNGSPAESGRGHGA